MNKKTYAARREAVRVTLPQKKLGALLVTLDANRYYLSGFELMDAQANESSGCLVIMPDGKDWLCTDARFYDAAKRLWDEDRIFIYRGNAAEQINQLLHDVVQGNVGFEAKNTSVAFFTGVSKGLTFVAADGIVESLRAIKEPEEVARLEASCAINHQLMRWLPSVLVAGRTEEAIAWDIEQFFRNNGAQGLAFSSIVAVNANAALPHAVPGATQLLEECAVLVDVGCRLNDYCSDQTRTFWVGEKPHAHYTKYYTMIQEAQQKSIEAMRPGVLASSVYNVAMQYLEERGAGIYFTHGLGHGIGLQTHEGPNLGPKSPTVLQEGMVITVEPGVYCGGHGGVRYEYMVLVTEDGARVL